MTRIEPSTYRPDVAIPPGETVAELLRDHEMSIFEFAPRVGLDQEESIRLLRGDRELTPEIADLLAELFGLPAPFWNNLEANYRACLARLGDRESTAQAIEFARSFPRAAMRRLGWIDTSTRWLETANSILRFLGISSPNEFRNTRVSQVAFRKSPTKKASNHALAAWLRAGEIKADQIQVGTFDEVAARDGLVALRGLTLLSPEEFGPRVISICRDFGVAVVYVPLIPKCYASGAAYKIGEKFVVQVSLRHKTDDHFWFSLFHELAHVILHISRRAETFLDDFVRKGDAREKEADEFASSALISKEASLDLVLTPRFTRESILEFSSRIDLSPGVVVGRLQHDRLIPRDRFNDLKRPIDSLG